MNLRRSVQSYGIIYHSVNSNEIQKQSAVNSGRDVVKCPQDHAICGVTVMMDTAGLGILTAIGLKCCHHCIPEEKWEDFHQLNNTGPSVHSGVFHKTVGIQLDFSGQNVQPDSTDLRNLFKSAGISLDVVRKGFSTRFGKSNSSGFDWSRLALVFGEAGKTITQAYSCEAQSSCVYKQLVGECGRVCVPVDKFCQVSVPVGSSIPGSCNKILDPLSITSCNVAEGRLSSPPAKKQWIFPDRNGGKIEVVCDFETDVEGGGWTIIQKRSSGPRHDFDRGWDDYVKGFGSLDGNFWLGLENIRALTKNGDQELRVEVRRWDRDLQYAKYLHFSISGASDFYRLSVKGFSGDAGDSMYSNNGIKFSTKDSDNDDDPDQNCPAEHSSGGWWVSTYC